MIERHVTRAVQVRHSDNWEHTALTSGVVVFVVTSLTRDESARPGGPLP